MKNLEIIRAKIKDDAVVLIDLIMRSKQDNIAVVLPKNSIFALNPNSLKNLKAQAESINKTLFIITTNEKIRAKAKNIGTLIYEAIEDIEVEVTVPEEVQIIPISKSAKITTRMVDIIAPNFNKGTEKDDNDDITNRDMADEELENEQDIARSQEDQEREDNLTLNLNLPEKNDLEKDVEEFYGVKQVPDPQAKLASKSTGFLQRIFAPARLIVLLVSFSAFTAFASLYLVLPKATIVLITKANPINATVPVTISKSVSTVNEAAGIIPGQFFSLSKSGSKSFAPASDSEKTVSAYAHGRVHIYNAYSAATQKLVSGTRFENKDGKIFKIQKSIIIPGAKVVGGVMTPIVIDAEVVASGPGQDYNIGPDYFTIPGFKDSQKFAGFYAKSTQSFDGGKIGKAKVLTQEDIDKAKDELQNELIGALKQEIIGANQNSLKIIDGASIIKIVAFHSSAKVGDAVDSFTLDAKVNWQAIAFRNSDLINVVSHFLGDKYPNLNTIQIEQSIAASKPQVDWSRGEMTFLATINDNLARIIDINNLKSSIAGKCFEEIRKIIASQEIVQSASINLWPFWVLRAPKSPNSIDISIVQGK